MKVDNPEFHDKYGIAEGAVICCHCPLTPQNGIAASVSPDAICSEWWDIHGAGRCPTAETYAEACRLAEQANKGEKDVSTE